MPRALSTEREEESPFSVKMTQDEHLILVPVGPLGPSEGIAVSFKDWRTGWGPGCLE